MSRHADSSGAFEVSSLPGQSQVAVCHSFFIDEGQRGRGRGHEVKAVQRKVLRGLRYDFAVCTVAAGNLAQKAVLAQAGWKKLSEFHNRRSSETTEIWGMTP